MGTTKTTGDCGYFLQDRKVVAKLSIVALHDLLIKKPNKVIVLGTNEALEVQADYLQDFRNRSGVDLELVKIPLGDSQAQSETLFQKTFELLHLDGDRRFCLDLTQGFRHQPMMLFLAGFIRGMAGECSISAYYSRIIGEAEIQTFKSKIQDADASVFSTCKDYFSCQLIDEFLEIGYISLILRLFPQSFNIPSFIHLHHDSFNRVKMALNEVAEAILENNIRLAIEKAVLAQEKLRAFLESPQGIFVRENALECIAILETLSQLRKKPRYLQMIGFGQLLLKRQYLLNASTFLYEGLLGFIRESTTFDIICVEARYSNRANEYHRTQVIKHLLLRRGQLGSDTPWYYRYFVHRNDLEVFCRYQLAPFYPLIDLLGEIEEIRNSAAHGFALTASGKDGSYSERLHSYYRFVEELSKTPQPGVFLSDSTTIKKIKAMKRRQSF